MKYYLKKRVFLLVMGMLGWTMAASGQEQTKASRPNVIIIYTDDLGYGDLSCYGATAIQTPHIDRLAAEGLRLTNAHSTASTCTPSRYSLLTGEYAFRNDRAHILPGNASLLISSEQETLGTLFKRAGYRTGVVGKWHIGLGPEEGPDWNREVTPGPNEIGFDYSFIFPATADRVPTVYVKNHEVIALEQEDPITVSYQQKVGREPTGKENPELLKMKSSHGHDGTIVNGIGRIGWMSGGQLARWTDEELAGDFLAEAKSFIERNKDTTFFLYYPVNEIHVPRMPSTLFKGASDLGYRGDVILEMDYVVGELMKEIERLDLSEETIILFSSDNGPVLDDGYVDRSVELAQELGHKPTGGLRGGKYSMYEGGTRLPFIIHWPGEIEENTSSDALFSHVDLLASFAHMLDQKISDKTDSRDLWEVLLGRSDQGRKDLIEQNNNGVLAYIKEGWKYIEPHKGPALNTAVNIETGFSPESQLFDLNKDKEEQFNVADRYPDRVESMKKELELLREIRYYE